MHFALHKKVSLDRNLGNPSVVLRSQTTLFASTFHALMPPSAVPMRSFFPEINDEIYKNSYQVYNNQKSEHRPNMKRDLLKDVVIFYL